LPSSEIITPEPTPTSVETIPGSSTEGPVATVWIVTTESWTASNTSARAFWWTGWPAWASGFEVAQARRRGESAAARRRRGACMGVVVGPSCENDGREGVRGARRMRLPRLRCRI
jgi:hypothetical protein